MKFVSTRGQAPLASVGQAMLAGLAPDGGLYVPERFPVFDSEAFAPCQTLPEVAKVLLAPFFEDDPLLSHLDQIVEEAFDFAVPLRTIAEGVSLLELFWGPTAAFKDFGARFLARCLGQMADPDDPITILVATSGDTGGAVAAAFHGVPGTQVVLLFPEGGVSPRQRRQLTCWDGNIQSFAVAGVFDDCQGLVKGAFADQAWQSLRLTSANSINVGRLLPQMAYYAWASLTHWRQTGRPATFVVPTGNVGNVCAGVWARACGLPIDGLVLATNANRPVVDFLETGVFNPRATIPTLANAMDVGNPSNLERLRHHYGDEDITQRITAYSVDDDKIRSQIAAEYARSGTVLCPHTACAKEVHERLALENAIVVATAHPAKFETVVEPIVGQVVPVPEPLEALLGLPDRSRSIPADLNVLREACGFRTGS